MDLKNIMMKKKNVIIIFFIVVMIVGFFVFQKMTQSKQDEKVYDLQQIGDASIDPENQEMDNVEGEIVEGETLIEETGKSLGIDVSKWQGKINWQQVKNNHIDFAFIRIGYRGENGTIYKDDNADYNIQQAQKAGILVGTYFYSTAISEQEAIEEANWTLQAIEGYSISYPVVYDCEGYQLSSSRMKSLNKKQRTNNAVAYLKTIKEAGYDAMFYGALSEVQNSRDWNMDQIEKQYKVWIAQYASPTYPQKEKPDYSGKCHAWQYTNKGTVSGIINYVDMVVCYFTKDKASPKNEAATPKTASTPLSDEEKQYTTVNETVTAKDETNLRQAASTNSNVVIRLKNGETVTRIGLGKNGWSKLIYNNQTVYAISSYLTTDLTKKEVVTKQEDVVEGQTFTAKNDQVTAKDQVNLRSLPTTNSDIVGTLKSGDFLQRSAISNKGWSRLNYNGQTVYAITSYLSHEVVQKPIPSKSDGFQTVDEQVTAKTETNLRTQPSTQNSQVVYLLKNGEYVKRIGISNNGWSKLEYNGQIVYAITSYLTS